MIITNNTEDVKYFNPSNMDNFIKMECEYKAFPSGSYIFFKDFEDYIPHDYDYLIFCKIDKHIKLPLFHYNYKHIADFFTVYHNNFSSPEHFIKFIIQTAYKYNHLFIVNLFNIDILNYFNITYNDLEPYFEEIEKFVNEFESKWAYYRYILKFIKENESLVLTYEQLQICYDIYKNNRIK